MESVLRVSSYVVLALGAACAGLVLLNEAPRVRAALTLVSLALIVAALGLRALAVRISGSDRL